MTLITPDQISKPEKAEKHQNTWKTIKVVVECSVLCHRKVIKYNYFVIL